MRIFSGDRGFAACPQSRIYVFAQNNALPGLEREVKNAGSKKQGGDLGENGGNFLRRHSVIISDHEG